MSKREASLGIVAGRKRIGKTYLTIQLLKQYVAGNAYKGIPPRRVLILDVNDEYGKGGGDIKAMRLRDVKLFSMHPTIEIRRIRPFNEDGTKMSLNDISSVLGYIIENFKGGLLMLEDLNKYTGDTLKQDIIGAICTNAHAACDIVIHLQSIGRILPKMYQNLSWVRYHKHYESVEENKSKVAERYEIFKLTELMVDRKYDAGDIRYNLHIDLDNNKIIGNYTREDFLIAIQTYLSYNFKSRVLPFANQVDMKGKKIYDVETAMRILRHQIYKTYYGN